MTTFHVGDILSLMTGTLVSPDGIGGVHRLAEHMAGGPVWTHQLPRVGREAEPVLRAAFPALAAIEVPTEWGDDPRAAVLAWVADVAVTHGAEHTVPTLGVDHTDIDPVSELRMMRPDMPVVVVEAPGEGES